MNGWEIIFSSDDERTERLGVHGGWLYRVLSWDLAGIIISQCMAFVPEPRKAPRGALRKKFSAEREAIKVSDAIEAYEDRVLEGDH